MTDNHQYARVSASENSTLTTSAPQPTTEEVAVPAGNTFGIDEMTWKSVSEGIDCIKAKARPMNEFIQGKTFSFPNLSDLAERVRSNINRYFYNYAAVFGGVSVVVAVRSPIALLFFGGAIYFIYKRIYTHGKKWRAFALGCVAAMITGCVGVLFSIVATAASLILGHAAFKTPVEAIDEAEREEIVD